jgi:hypothetical protein
MFASVALSLHTSAAQALSLHAMAVQQVFWSPGLLPLPPGGPVPGRSPKRTTRMMYCALFVQLAPSCSSPTRIRHAWGRVWGIPPTSGAAQLCCLYGRGILPGARTGPRVGCRSIWHAPAGAWHAKKACMYVLLILGHVAGVFVRCVMCQVVLQLLS